jgi:hypothetical protein
MCHNGAFRGHAERTSDGEVLVVDQPLDDLSARGCGGVKDDSGRLLAAWRGQCGAEDRCARRREAAHLEQRARRAHGHLARYWHGTGTVLAWYWHGLAWYWRGAGYGPCWQGHLAWYWHMGARSAYYTRPTVQRAPSVQRAHAHAHAHLRRVHMCGVCTLSTETRGAGVRLTAGEAAASRARPDGVRPRIAG